MSNEYYFPFLTVSTSISIRTLNYKARETELAMKTDIQDQIIFLILYDTRYESPTVSDYELSDFLIPHQISLIL